MNRQAEIERAVQAYWGAVRACDEERRVGEPATGEAVGHAAEGTRPASRPGAGERGPRPNIPLRQHITEYSAAELDSLMRWLLSDGRPHTDQELIRAAMEELGFRRRGKRIDEALKRALERVRRNMV